MRRNVGKLIEPPSAYCYVRSGARARSRSVLITRKRESAGRVCGRRRVAHPAVVSAAGEPRALGMRRRPATPVPRSRDVIILLHARVTLRSLY